MKRRASRRRNGQWYFNVKYADGTTSVGELFADDVEQAIQRAYEGVTLPGDVVVPETRPANVMVWTSRTSPIHRRRINGRRRR
jgi:hypothetical protein